MSDLICASVLVLLQTNTFLWVSVKGLVRLVLSPHAVGFESESAGLRKNLGWQEKHVPPTQVWPCFVESGVDFLYFIFIFFFFSFFM